MEFDETKDIKLKDKPLLTVIEAAKYFGIGKNKMNDLSWTIVNKVDRKNGKIK